jgi:ABC-type lipoprotein export system ATPase subunit
LPEPLLTCAGLSKTYETPTGGIEALHEVGASFTAGEITAVVGPSGSGKSTLLRALAGLDRPTAGSLRANGDELSHASPEGLRRHRLETVTFVNQKASDNFVPHLTVAEHGEASPGAAEGLLADFGLAGRLGSRPAELSGGEQARAAFALALARSTPAIVADEPTAELDRDSASRLLEAIRRHAGEGTAFVLATHDPDVVAIADRVLYLDRGRVVEGPKARSGAARRAVGPSTGEVAVSVRGVAKSFRRRAEVIQAVTDATFELRRGELAALLGRSGSGKSTMLTLLAGWQKADAGEIRFEPDGAAPASLPWRRLAFLPQRFGLLPELSVRENVEYPARLAGELAGRSASIEALLAALGLDELAHRPPHETSIGQQQRTALARALALSPDVLLADEPTSHQDAGWRDRVWELLEQAAANGTSSLIATHEEAARDHATRVWAIGKGVVAESR